MKRGTLHKMINTVWNLWTSTEIKDRVADNIIKILFR